MLSKRALAAAVLTLLAAVPATASAAGTVTGTGGTYTYTGTDGNDTVTITRSGGDLVFDEASGTATDDSAECAQTDPNTVTCTNPGGTYPLVTVNLLGSQDSADGSGANGTRFVMNGGDVGDSLTGADQGDDLNGEGDSDTLTGGGGNDDLDGGGGSDVLAGGDGADTLTGGANNPDDCGDWASYTEKANNLTITLDGVANDDTGDGDVIGGDVESSDGGSGNDTITGSEADNCLSGGGGTDVLNGLGGDDTLRGNAGGDTLNGAAGDDHLYGDESGAETPLADAFNGGEGVDEAYLYSTRCIGMSSCEPRTVNVSLDGQANDGQDGEGDNVAADVEDVNVTGSGAANVTGSGEFNVVDTDDGNDTIDPFGGSDYVISRDGDDTVNTRDGFSDRVDCGTGTDTANVDQLDTVRDCEVVNRETRDVALEDRPPTVRLTAPGGTAIPANRPTVLRAEAADDRGVARVLFVDDDRVVCNDTEAPYDCSYQPRAGDVNRNTLVAVAIDTSEQSAFAGRTVTVPRFTATQLTARTTPRRDRRRPFRFTTTGRLLLPSVLPTARPACRGRISIQVKTGGATISTRRTSLTRRCTYRSRVTFRVPRRLVRRALKVTVRFAGNSVVAPRNARSYYIRTS